MDESLVDHESTLLSGYIFLNIGVCEPDTVSYNSIFLSSFAKIYVFPNDLFLAAFKFSALTFVVSASFPFQTACLTSPPGCSAHTHYGSYKNPSFLLHLIFLPIIFTFF